MTKVLRLCFSNADICAEAALDNWERIFVSSLEERPPTPVEQQLDFREKEAPCMFPVGSIYQVRDRHAWQKAVVYLRSFMPYSSVVPGLIGGCGVWLPRKKSEYEAGSVCGIGLHFWGEVLSLVVVHRNSDGGAAREGDIRAMHLILRSLLELRPIKKLQSMKDVKVFALKCTAYDWREPWLRQPRTPVGNSRPKTPAGGLPAAAAPARDEKKPERRFRLAEPAPRLVDMEHALFHYYPAEWEEPRQYCNPVLNVVLPSLGSLVASATSSEHRTELCAALQWPADGAMSPLVALPPQASEGHGQFLLNVITYALSWRAAAGGEVLEPGTLVCLSGEVFPPPWGSEPVSLESPAAGPLN